jgi:hypothetical protein
VLLALPAAARAETFDVITMWNPAPNVIVWHIDRPNVTRCLTEYPNIRFLPGDVVAIEAGGWCQTGGSGLTCKRYVDPRGRVGGLDDQYFGLIKIPGITDQFPSSPVVRVPGLARFYNVLYNGGTYRIPTNFANTQDLFLRLGYEDDGYGDNGYWGRDPGTANQCDGLPNAFVQLTIFRSPGASGHDSPRGPEPRPDRHEKLQPVPLPLPSPGPAKMEPVRPVTPPGPGTIRPGKEEPVGRPNVVPPLPGPEPVFRDRKSG